MYRNYIANTATYNVPCRKNHVRKGEKPSLLGGTESATAAAMILTRRNINFYMPFMATIVKIFTTNICKYGATWI